MKMPPTPEQAEWLRKNNRQFILNKDKMKYKLSAPIGYVRKIKNDAP